MMFSENLRKTLVLALPISGNDAASNLSQIAPITCASEALQVRFMGPRRIDFLRRQNGFFSAAFRTRKRDQKRVPFLVPR